MQLETASHLNGEEVGSRRRVLAGQTTSFANWALAALREVSLNIAAGLRKAGTIELAVVFTGYLLLHITIGTLFYKMRRIGSRWTLGLAAICSSVSAFLMALCAVGALGYSVDLVFFSEAIPFLVVTVGFEKPYTLAKAVLTFKPTTPGASQDEHAAERQTCAGLDKVLPRLLRDYLFEISVLGFGIVSGVPGLSVFCLVCAFTLLFDCLLQFTLFVAVLALKCELMLVRREHEQARAGGSTAATADGNSTALLRDPDDNTEGSEAKQDVTQSVAVARFKLIMIILFLGMHIFNICSAFHGHLPGASASVSAFDMLLPDAAHLNPESPGVRGPLAALTTEHRRSGDTRGLLVELTTPIAFQTQSLDAEFSLADSLVTLLIESFGGPLRGHARNASYEQWLAVALCLSLTVNWYLYSGNKKHSTTEPRSDKAAAAAISSLSTPASTAAAPAVRSAPRVPVAKTVTEPAPAQEVQMYKRGTPEDIRALDECVELLASDPAALTDEEVIHLVQSGKLPGYALEKRLGDFVRAVKIRRAVVSRASTTGTLEDSMLPVDHYDYTRVFGQCCENVIGYTPIPIGVAGPIRIDGKMYHIPMTTTEGCLIASASRGCKAITAGGGASTVVVADGMTRGPAIEFPCVTRAAEFKRWMDSEEGFATVCDAFNSTSRFARLQSAKVTIAGTLVFVRFKATTGDAMGMNMISKGVEKALTMLGELFEDMCIVSISGNTCSDKKPAAINWIEGRGKSTIAECVVPGQVVRSVLKTTVDDLVRLNTSKNLIGSAVAGSVGGFNAHASNILTAIYLATGQDPAQNVESSQCMTLMRAVNDGQDLHLTCTMPCIEVGTIGGGTQLPAQAACLEMLGVRGAHATIPGDNARQLARIICASVMAGELSLCAALAAGHLVKSHMAHNRAKPAAPAAAVTSPETAQAPGPEPGSCLRS
ncbi:hydroxymethylglutaryl-coenzyme A reductase-domain-containing protein [Thamnocephalis sphaerospora]|uniref:3-hydroxy-3-methylglutaryl coenzyme A reductase n=1 Tax=Thamnocephalis sphaerospora TaxID=78915 RepID=A0A4P9XRD4_9FUNG|nr:hydroxymethylglutaryl-coenzyme A reductase-domain-containing protein [Thamnocephalis sphaerospora]|eukprot:RKP08644.1 hydroxymethylglutaryl-coenzyme A reductase-domain-containing protein [Thamnocephalis sphaerospora]